LAKAAWQGFLLSAPESLPKKGDPAPLREAREETVGEVKKEPEVQAG